MMRALDDDKFFFLLKQSNQSKLPGFLSGGLPQ